MDKPETQRSKEPYSPPTLTVHGTIEELTKKVGTRGHPDGGKFPVFKTHI